MSPTLEQHGFVEKVGRWWDMVGAGRSAGRILGWLMVCEPPHRSAPQLIEELRLSAGTVSTQTTMLGRIGLVERITFPGDRATYYQLPPNVWIELMKSESDRFREMQEIAEAGAAVLPKERPGRVEDLGRLASFLLEEWPATFERLTRYVKEQT